MAQDLNSRIAKGSEVPLGLILLSSQCRLKAPDDDVQLLQRLKFHVAFTDGTQVELDGAQDPEFLTRTFQGVIHGSDLGSFLAQLCFQPASLSFAIRNRS